MNIDEYKIRHDYENALRNLNEETFKTLSSEEKIEKICQPLENYNSFIEGRIPEVLSINGGKPDETICASQLGIDVIYEKHHLDTTFNEISTSHAGSFQAELFKNIQNNLNLSDEQLEAYNK